MNELDPPEVPQLAVTNLSDLPVLLVEGEMLVGGDQNRTMNVTVLCPPRTRTVVPVSCVEAGRWGARRTMSGKRKHAPGSLRAAKTAYLEPRSDDVGHAAPTRVWCGKRCAASRWRTMSTPALLLSMTSRKRSRTASRSSSRASSRSPTSWEWSAPSGTKWWGLTSSTAPSALSQYLRAIVAGHALDDVTESGGGDPIAAIERFLAQVDASHCDTGKGVGLGDEVLLAVGGRRGPVLRRPPRPPGGVPDPSRCGWYVRVKIHRGAHEIGGSCIEVECGGGEGSSSTSASPIIGRTGRDVPLPEVRGFHRGRPFAARRDYHPSHQDHWGLADQIDPAVPIYMGAATNRILAEADFWTQGLDVCPRDSWSTGYRSTSARSGSRLPERPQCVRRLLPPGRGRGRRLFYTGDIRGHGRKADLFEQLLRDPPQGVDVLLMEGTNIRPDGADGD